MENKKTVNLAKLSGLTDHQLAERINKCASKIDQKKARLLSQIEEIKKQLADYIEYRNQDLAACKKILEDRQKAKAALPKGNEIKGKVA